MDKNPVIATLGRRLRLAVIGGGPGSFIGAMHRAAARIDDRYELVAAALSSDPARAIAFGEELGIPRPYPGAGHLLAAEADGAAGADVIAIMTPNDSHHTYAIAALENGFDVICDKPMANTLPDALDILRRVEETGLVFCLTHNYTGYPMVRQARAMVAGGRLGDIRLVTVEYVQGGKARAGDPTGPDVPWRYDPTRGGPSLVLGDIGSHAHNLVRFVTGLEVAEVSGEAGHVVPDRRIHDYAAALLHFDNGARGTMWVTQAAAGMENALRIRVSGSQATLEWSQESPTRLLVRQLDEPAQVYTPNGPGTLPAAARSTRIVAGHPEGFPEAFANLYSDAAEAIAARRVGIAPDPLSLQFPNARDGAIGVRFMEAVLESSANGGAWTGATLETNSEKGRHP